MSMRTRIATATVSSLTFALAALTLATVVGVRQAPAQTPNWPDFANFPDKICMGTGGACALSPGPVTGCTIGIPAQWNIGGCSGVGNGCNLATFMCGPMYVCMTGRANGQQCPSPNICQPD
jgi:hypothetical protein